MMARDVTSPPNTRRQIRIATAALNDIRVTAFTESCARIANDREKDRLVATLGQNFCNRFRDRWPACDRLEMALPIRPGDFGQGVIIKIAIDQNRQRHGYVLVLRQGPDYSGRRIVNRSQSFREARPGDNFHLLAQPDQYVVEQRNLLLV